MFKETRPSILSHTINIDRIIHIQNPSRKHVCALIRFQVILSLSTMVYRHLVYKFIFTRKTFSPSNQIHTRTQIQRVRLFLKTFIYFYFICIHFHVLVHFQPFKATVLIYWIQLKKNRLIFFLKINNMVRNSTFWKMNGFI